MDNFQGLYSIRDYHEADKSFVLATFLRGIYYGDSWFSKIPKNIFMANYKPVANNFVTSPKYTIKIACLNEDPNIILGYSILSSDYQNIVYVFVKTAWRKKGIARSLVPKYPLSVSHLTKLGLLLLSKLDSNVFFNPFHL